MIKNYQILKESISSVIQKSDLDIGAVYFIFKDLFREIEILYYNQINKELAEEESIFEAKAGSSSNSNLQEDN